jgi:hypothetical protein
MDLSQRFYAANPPTRLRLRHETLSGTLYSLTSGQADLAIGVPMNGGTALGLRFAEMGAVMDFVFLDKELGTNVAQSHKL